MLGCMYYRTPNRDVKKNNRLLLVFFFLVVSIENCSLQQTIYHKELCC